MKPTITLPKLARRAGPFPCKGRSTVAINPVANVMNPEQLAWMQANKPLYTGCSLTEALPHLPPNLRHV